MRIFFLRSNSSKIFIYLLYMSALYLLLIIPIIGIYFIFTLDCFKHEAFIGGYTNTNTNVDTTSHKRWWRKF